jgi:hypothetical protein
MQIRGIHPHYSLRGEEKEMRIARFVLATLVFCLALMLYGAYTYNTGVNGAIDWNTFGDSLLEAFGGLGSLLALLAVIGLLALAYLAVYRLAQMNRNSAAAGLGVTLIVIALIVGTAWVRIDWNFFGGIWPFLGFLLFGAVVTAIMAAILGATPLRRRTVTTSPTTTTTTV